MKKSELIGTLFMPTKEIREFDASKFIGKRVKINLQHCDDEKTDQYVTCDLSFNKADGVMSSGWAGKVLRVLKKNTDGHVFRVIKDVYLTGHMNGGRDHKRAKSYAEFFNAEQKEKVHAQMCGRIGRMMGGGGEADQADIVVVFEDFKLDSYAWDFKAPEEWYSELHASNSKFRFADGFYADAAAAIESFSKKSTDDLFGERYFPVLVFPLDKWQDTRDIIWRPKAVSKPIIVGKSLIYGTRCKPAEYQEVITTTYAAGGQVPVGLMWDWEV